MQILQVKQTESRLLQCFLHILPKRKKNPCSLILSHKGTSYRSKPVTNKAIETTQPPACTLSWLKQIQSAVGAKWGSEQWGTFQFMLQYRFPLCAIIYCYNMGSPRPRLKLEPAGLSVVQKEGKADSQGGEGGAASGGDLVMVTPWEGWQQDLSLLT